MTSSNGKLTVILPGKLIDGVQDASSEGMSVAFDQSGIKWIGKRGDVENAEPDRPREILDFPDSTLLPGLFDLHTHTNMPGDGPDRRGSAPGRFG